MKKILMMFTALMMFITLTANAQKTNFNVKSGDSKILLEKKTACVEFDYSNTVVGKYDDGIFTDIRTLDGYLENRGEDFVRDWPKNHVKAESYFTIQFEKKISKKKGGMVLVDSDSNPVYKILIHVDTLDMGSAAAGVLSSAIGFGDLGRKKPGGTIFVGSVELINLGTGKPDCVFEGLVKAQFHPSETIRLGMTYYDIMTNMLSLAEDGVSSDGSVAVQTEQDKSSAQTKKDEPKKNKKDEPKKDDKPAAPTASNSGNTIEIVNMVSPKLKFEDNMVIKNGTKLFIKKVSVIDNGTEVASAQSLGKGDESKIKKFSEGELKSFRGKTLTVRIECEQAVSQGIQLYVEYDDDDDDFVIEIKASKK